jgi:HAD superfamily hydrolase (TIGR01509 family)
MDVAALLFDLDGVLYDDTVWYRWLFRLLGRMGLHTQYRAFFHVWQHEFLDDVHRGQRDFWDALRAFLLTSGLTTGQTDEVLAAGHARRRQLQESIRPLPGVLAVTAKLQARGIPLAILCNSAYPADDVAVLLRRLGLSGRFQPVLSSYDLHYTKPAPQSYRAALSALSLEPPQVAYVGHDDAELAGARAVGMQTIAINYDRDAEADCFLQGFHELRDVVRCKSLRLLAG